MQKIVFFCIAILFLGIVFSKIRISVEEIEVNINSIKFKIKIGFFLFGIIKIFGIKCNEKGFWVLKLKVPYERIFKMNLMKFIKINIKNSKNKNTIKKLNLKIDLAKFILKVGIEDVFITMFFVVAFSGIIAEILKNKMNKINAENLCYKVIPEFNKLDFKYEGILNISFRTLKLLKI